MPTLAFRTHDQTTIATTIEQSLRTETNNSAPIPFAIYTHDPIPGALLSEIYRAAFGGRAAPNHLFTQHFTLAHPRPCEVTADVNKRGIGAYTGSLVYTTVLPTPLAAPVHVDMHKAPIFIGDAAVVEPLNQQADLRKQLGTFLRKSLAVSGTSIHITPFLRLLPHEGRTLVAAHTLPKAIKLGFGMILDAHTWLTIIAAIERAL